MGRRALAKWNPDAHYDFGGRLGLDEHQDRSIQHPESLPTPEGSLSIPGPRLPGVPLDYHSGALNSILDQRRQPPSPPQVPPYQEVVIGPYPL